MKQNTFLSYQAKNPIIINIGEIMENSNSHNNKRQCLVICNVSNLAGYLNKMSDTKIRIDYKELLNYAANEREVIGALCVSQYDLAFMSNKSVEYRNKNKKFLFSLQALGWTPLQVPYDANTKDMDVVFQAVWRSMYKMLMDEQDQPAYDFANIDLVFITGTALWMSVISPFYTNGFNIEVLYPKKSTSSELSSTFVFRDLQGFVNKSIGAINATIKK